MEEDQYDPEPPAEDPEPPLDQSNGEVPDDNKRFYSINTALAAIVEVGGKPSELVKLAREIYLFVAGRDPVVDFEGPLPDNVVILNEVKAAKGL